MTFLPGLLLLASLVQVIDFLDTNFWNLASDQACDVADIALGGASGVLLVE
jgi:hypothetical protein